jgi:hypothetical protein
LQFRFVSSLIVFVGSYLPLSLILLAQDFDYAKIGNPICWTIFDPASGCSLPFHNPGYGITIFAVCTLCLVLSLIALSTAKPTVLIDVKSASYVPSELMNYTLPYVVSLMALDYQETGKFVGLIIFLAWMFWITHKSGQVILNPVLVAFGWRLYDLNYVFPGDHQERSGKALSNDLLEPGKRYKHTVIQDVMILRPTEGE